MSITSILARNQDKLPNNSVISIESKFNALPKDKQERVLAYLETFKMKSILVIIFLWTLGSRAFYDR